MSDEYRLYLLRETRKLVKIRNESSKCVIKATNKISPPQRVAGSASSH